MMGEDSLRLKGSQRVKKGAFTGDLTWAWG